MLMKLTLVEINYLVCTVCKCWYFINENLNYQRYVCDGCHDIFKSYWYT